MCNNVHSFYSVHRNNLNYSNHAKKDRMANPPEVKISFKKKNAHGDTFYTLHLHH